MGLEHVVTSVLEKRTVKNGQDLEFLLMCIRQHRVRSRAHMYCTVLYSGLPHTSDPGPLAPGPTVGCCLEGFHTKWEYIFTKLTYISFHFLIYVTLCCTFCCVQCLPKNAHFSKIIRFFKFQPMRVPDAFRSVLKLW